MEAIIFDRDGQPIEVDDDIIPDGATLRVPMPFMDSAVSAALHAAFGDAAFDSAKPLHDGMGNPAGYKPGFAYGGPVADHARAHTARQAYVDAVTSAWRDPPPLQVPPSGHSNALKPAPKPPQRDGHRAWQAYVARTANAWKHPT
jgi:hypothetical protein